MDPVTFTAEVRRFSDMDGWCYVFVPDDLGDELAALSPERWTPVRAVVESVAWDGSLLPTGDGNTFLVVKAAIRRRLGIEVGDFITLDVTVRSKG